ncbi:MAG TPA: DUF3617 family protein [Verrucomicrobiae bacterium]|nr:DUF3617 family protein [Verrucomicrobiae bacterium]
MKIDRRMAALLGLALAVPAFAGDAMKPGKYSYTVKMEMPGMPFALPPQIFEHCVTQADIDQGQQYSDQQNKDCEVKNLKQTAGKATFDVACKDGTTGKAEYSYGGDQMSGKTVLNTQGRTMTMNMNSRRLGAC